MYHSKIVNRLFSLFIAITILTGSLPNLFIDANATGLDDFIISYSHSNYYYSQNDSISKSEFEYNAAAAKYEARIELPMIVALGQDISFSTTYADIINLPESVKIERVDDEEAGWGTKDCAVVTFTYNQEDYELELVRSTVDCGGINQFDYTINGTNYSIDFNLIENSTYIGKDDNIIRIPLAAGDAVSGTEISGLTMKYAEGAAQGVFDKNSVILDENGSAKAKFTMTSLTDSTKQEVYGIYFGNEEKQTEFNINCSSTNEYYTYSEALMKSDFTFDGQSNRYEAMIELPMIVALGQDISFSTTCADIMDLPALAKINRANDGELGTTNKDYAHASFTYKDEKYYVELVRTNLDFAGIKILKYEVNNDKKQIDFNNSEEQIRIGEDDNITYIELSNDLPEGTEIALEADIYHDSSVRTYKFEESTVTLDGNGKAAAKLIVTSEEDSTRQEVYIFKFQSKKSDYIKAASVSILNTETTIEVGASVNLKAQVLPANASNKSVIWTVDNTQLAIIEDNCLVAKAPGSVLVTVKSLENDDIYSSKTIHIKESEFNINCSSINDYYTYSETLKKSDFTLNGQSNRYEARIELPMIVALGQDISFSTTCADIMGLPESVKIKRVDNEEAGWGTKDCAVVTFTYNQEDYELELVRTNLDFAGINILKYEVNNDKKQIGFNNSEEQIRIGEDDNITYIELSNDLPEGTEIALDAIMYNSKGSEEFEESTVALDGNGKATAKLMVTSVKNPAKQEVYIFKFQSKKSDYIKAASVSILNTETTIEVGASVNLKAQVLPANASNKSVIWTVSNAQLAIIEDNCTLVAKAPGSVLVTVKSLENDAIYSSKTIHVKSKPIEDNKPVEDKKPKLLKLNKTSVKLKKNKTFTIKPTVSPISAKGQVKYKSNNTKIATVSKKGKVKGVAGGNATITATLGAKKLRVKVTVLDPVRKLKVKKSTLKIKRGKKQQITVTTVPKRTSDKISFKSKNRKIAKVSKNGLVSALRKGTTTITVRATSGKNIKVKIRVI